MTPRGEEPNIGECSGIWERSEIAAVGEGRTAVAEACVVHGARARRPACTTYSRRLQRRRERERDVSKCPNASASSSLVRHSVSPTVSQSVESSWIARSVHSTDRSVVRSTHPFISDSDFDALCRRKEACQSERVNECSAGQSVIKLRAMFGDFWAHIA